MMRLAAAALAVLTMVGAADARTWRIRADAGAEQALQTALLDARPGDTVQLARGRFELSRPLSLGVDRVTIRGEGEDKSILAGQGLVVTSNGVELRDFAVENARGDGIAARDCAGITLRDVRTDGGGHGVAVSNCSNVLIRGVIARGASAGGVYVSQSRTVIVRDSVAERAGVGIVVENSAGVDMFGNVVRGNATGVMVEDAPGSARAGASVRVFRNEITGASASVGVLVGAYRDVAVFDNEIGDNGGVNVLVSAYRGEFQDTNFNPLPRNVMIRDNRFGNAGFDPSRELAALGVPLPDVLWDGATLYSVGGTPRSESVRLVVRDNRSTRTRQGSFLSLGLPVAGSPYSEAAPDATYPPLLELREPEAVEIDD